MTDQVIREQLANGLTVLLKEIHSAPLVTHWVWYRAGSRNERPGETGISHLVEHMQFKGTPRFPARVLDKAISRTGGIWNAFTSMDWTAYFETLPARDADLALDLESDRMIGSTFDPHEFDSERTVVISEREGNENEPFFRLHEAVQEAAFSKHPYKHEVIGYLEDLRNVTRDQLYAYYRSHYAPSNAVVGIAGDFNAQEMLEKVQTRFGQLPSAPAPRDTIPQETAPLDGEKRVEVQGPGETTFLEVAYRAPAGSDPQFFTSLVMDSLLSGPSSLRVFGGATSNRTSRLYKALVERDLAINVSGDVEPTIDPYLYTISLTVRPGVSPEVVLRALDDELRRLREEPVSEEEIQKAIKQARAFFVYGNENVTNQGFWLGHAEMFATYQWFENYLDSIARVTADDIHQLAQTMLNPTQRVIGTYLPWEKEDQP